MLPDLSKSFPKYTDYEPVVPVYCVTPELSGTVHRFFDTSPFSPSGRYIALTRFPFEDRLPIPGDKADVLLVDLTTGEQHLVAETRGWDTQLGAQVQWGADDHCLFFNDVDTNTWKPFGVKVDPIMGKRKELDGTVYMVSPDGKWAASPCLLRMGVTQAGYGVIVPAKYVPRNHGASSEDGLYITNTQTGKCSLLISLEEIFVSAIPPFDRARYKNGDFYGFHVKWNPQGTRLMFVLRWLPRKNFRRWFIRNKFRTRLNNVITMNADGSNVRVAIPDSQWCKGGHHPNWCPDGEHLIMNLNVHGEGLRFIRARYDGTGLSTLNDSVTGSGHPTMHPDGRHVLTDAYCGEPVAFGDGTTPIRWIDLHSSEEKHLARIRTLPDFKGKRKQLRVDPHPAWDRDFKRIAFNACPHGKRKVFVAELGADDLAPKS